MSSPMKNPKMKKSPDATFDCVAFKRQAQEQWRETTRGMTAEESRQHSRRVIESGPLAGFWQKVGEHAKVAPKRGRA